MMMKMLMTNDDINWLIDDDDDADCDNDNNIIITTTAPLKSVITNDKVHIAIQSRSFA